MSEGNTKKHFKKVEDIECWVEAIELVILVYKVIENNPDLKRDYSMSDQLKRACVSVPSNIAEGFERFSNKEFIRFLYISKGSCAELRTQIYICYKVGYISKQDYILVYKKCLKVSSMIANLIKYLNRKEY